MKRFVINTVAAAALLAGGLTLSGAFSAKTPGAQDLPLGPGPSAGSCHCAAGQSCSLGWLGGCECYAP